LVRSGRSEVTISTDGPVDCFKAGHRSADDHSHRGGAVGDEAGQHVPCRQIRHGRRDDTGEGRPDGLVLEAVNDIAGKHAQVGAEIPVRPAW
jgi:hypothetical protein